MALSGGQMQRGAGTDAGQTGRAAGAGYPASADGPTEESVSYTGLLCASHVWSRRADKRWGLRALTANDASHLFLGKGTLAGLNRRVGWRPPGPKVRALIVPGPCHG
jgi:hypothetical protein